MAEHTSSSGSVSPHRLMLLVTVVQKGKGTFFADFLQTFEANLQICVVGTGTARDDLVEFLGLKDNARTGWTRSLRRWRSGSTPSTGERGSPLRCLSPA